MYFAAWFRYSAALAAIASFAVFCTQASADNDPISTWTFETNPPGGAGCGTTPACPMGTDISGIAADSGPGTALGHHASAATVWSNPAGNGSVESWSSNNFGIGDYYQFQSSTTGFSDIGLIFDHTSSGTGPADWKVQYSTNGTSFIDSGLTYSILNPPVSWSSTTAHPETTYGIDLRNIQSLNNLTDVYFRLVDNSTVSANGGTVATTGTSRVDNFMVVHNFIPLEPPPPPPEPRLPQPGDVVFGLSTSSPTTTFQLVNGPASMNGGVRSGTPWQSDAFIQGVKFDNYNGQSHNAHGNLLGVNFAIGGAAGSTGGIYSFATTGSIPAPPGQLIGNTGATDPVGQSGSLITTRLGGLSVSPDNSKIAVMGFDSGSVIVYDYTPGDTTGAGAALANGRETSTPPLTTGSTQGTAWKDNNTVLAFSSFGSLFEVDATSMSANQVAFVSTPFIGGNGSALAYNPEVSPYVYAMYSGFDSGSSTPATNLYIFDPTNGYSLLTDSDGISLNGSLPSEGRDIALDKDGNLFISAYGGTISFIPDVVSNPSGIADNSSVVWYTSPAFVDHSGIDIAFGEVTTLTGDYNNDGKVDAADYVIWRKTGINGPQGYTDWRANFGSGLPGAGAGSGLGGAAVPEPASVVLLLLGLAAFCSRRHSA